MSFTVAAPTAVASYPYSQQMSAGAAIVRPVTPPQARIVVRKAETPDVAAGIAITQAETSDNSADLKLDRPLSGTGSLPAALHALRLKTVAMAKDPQLQTLALSMGGGGLALGAAGGAGGMAVGGATGAAVGVLPALFTFGLSIPVGGVVGGTVGTIGGVVIGSGTGIATGGLAYKYRIEIKGGVVSVQAYAQDVYASAKMKCQEAGDQVNVRLVSFSAASKQKAEETIIYTKAKAIEMLEKSKTKCLELRATSCDLVKNRTAQVTAASSAAGGVALGTAGGAVGLATGGVAGAAVGVVPALFTFGLSIPFCACIGAASGCFIGTTAGGSIGAVGGGVAGNRIYVKRESIKNGVMYIKDKAQELPNYAKEQVYGA